MCLSFGEGGEDSGERGLRITSKTKNTWVNENNPLFETTYTEEALRNMGNDSYHGFPLWVDQQADKAIVTDLIGGDKVLRKKVEIPGGIVNGQNGSFVYIIEPDGSINHRFFEVTKNQ